MKKNANAARLAKIKTEIAVAQRKLRAASALTKSLKEKGRQAKVKATEAWDEWKQIRKSRKRAAKNEKAARKALRASEKKAMRINGKLPVRKKAKTSARATRQKTIAVVPNAEMTTPSQIA